MPSSASSGGGQHRPVLQMRSMNTEGSPNKILVRIGLLFHIEIIVALNSYQILYKRTPALFPP